MKLLAIASITASLISISTTPALAEVIEGDGEVPAAKAVTPHVRATANELVILDAFSSPLAEAKAFFVIGLEGPNARGELVEIQQRITCRLAAC